MKKLISGLLVLTLCLLITSTFSAAGASKEKAETAVVTFWNHPLAPDPAWEESFWKELINNFHSEHPSIEVKLEWVPWGQMWSKLVAAIEAGNPPDIHHAGDIHMLAFVPDGEILPLDDLLAELGGEKAFSPLLKNYQCKGHTYGLPYVEGGYIFYYNKELFEKAGYSRPPKDWDEMVEIAQAVTNPNKGVFGVGVDYSAGNGCEQVFVNYEKAADGPVIDKKGNVIFDDPRNVKVLKFYTDLGMKYKVVPPGVTAITAMQTTSTPLMVMFGNEQIAMMTYWQLGTQQLKNSFPETWEKTGVSLIPAGPSGHSGSFAAANPIYIHSKTQHPEEAKEFLRYFFQKEAYAEWIEKSGWIPGLNAAWDLQPKAKWREVAREQMKTMWRGFGPGGAHPKNGAAWESFIRALMVQDVVCLGMTPKEAVKKAHEAYVEIYSSGGE